MNVSKQNENNCSWRFYLILFGIVCLLGISPRNVWGERVYATVPQLNVRSLPSTHGNLVDRIRHGRWITVIEKSGQWLKVRTSGNKTGFVLEKYVTDKWIKILKDERKLVLMKDMEELHKYSVGLGFNPSDDKVKLGDGCTPEGRFYICEVQENPQPPETYGPVSLRISYPNIEDARRGLKDKLITKAEYLAIVKRVNKGIIPPRRTRLGSSIKIHGGIAGSLSDWTRGCIAISNGNMRKLHEAIPGKGVMVEIYRNRIQEKMARRPGFVNEEIIKKAEKMLKGICYYTSAATKIIPLSYPMGDIKSSEGVCTDVAIRALRGVNIDLQALLYEDIVLNPGRYSRIKRPNPNIDHRRTRNLKIFFDNNAEVLTNTSPVLKPYEWRPGDIVLMDTGIKNGTIYDHIGIVSKRKSVLGIPLVINLWTVGCSLNEMELLSGVYPKIVGHYRLHHPLYYDADLK